MTLNEAAELYDVNMSYYHNDKVMGSGWYWFVECGYQSFSSHNSYRNSHECEMSLRNFLLTWEGPTK